MEITLNYIGDKKFEAQTSKSSFLIDAEKITPVEYFAAGIIGCTGIDLVALANKDGFEVREYSVKAEIDRKLSIPYKFEKLHIIYSFKGDFESIKAKRYILSSLENYCTTVNSIRESVKIEYTIVYNGETIANCESIRSGTADSLVLEDGFGGACCS